MTAKEGFLYLAPPSAYTDSKLEAMSAIFFSTKSRAQPIKSSRRGWRFLVFCHFQQIRFLAAEISKAIQNKTEFGFTKMNSV